ncbi:MAG: integrase [Deltaproteobacteria bacterium]|nr:integrase [Deltaproteobacteria bacterium]
MTVARHQRKWRYDFWKNGVRQRKSGYLTKQDARIAEAEARKRLKNTNVSFIKLCASRLRDLEERRTKQYFYENKRLIEKLILMWGNKKEITRKDIEDYLSERVCKSSFIANSELRMIKALFHHGVEREILIINPASKIKLYPVSKSKKYIPPIEDIVKVLASASKREKNYLLALISTMARVGEINKLKWEDVHGDSMTLRTRKSKNSNLTEREIPINSTLESVLEAMPKISEYVFCYKKTGKPYKYRSKLLKRACQKAKVKPFGYHAIRHYGASRLADSGVPITDIQVLLGHQRTSTTDIYLQSIKQSLKEAMGNLEI